MSKPEDEAVQGATVITVADSIFMTLHLFLSRALIFALTLFAGLILVPIIFGLLNPDSIAAQDPAGEVGRVISRVWAFPPIGALLLLIFVLICNAALFLRLPRSTRTLTYIADAAGMHFIDGDGCTGFMPWKTVRKATRTRRFISLRKKVGPVRFVLFRAFSDPEKIWALVKRNTQGQ